MILTGKFIVIIITITIMIIIIIIIMIIIAIIIISLRPENTGLMLSRGQFYLLGRGILFSLGWQS